MLAAEAAKRCFSQPRRRQISKVETLEVNPQGTVEVSKMLAVAGDSGEVPILVPKQEASYELATNDDGQ